jgi:hypothetical protein
MRFDKNCETLRMRVQILNDKVILLKKFKIIFLIIVREPCSLFKREEDMIGAIRPIYLILIVLANKLF